MNPFSPLAIWRPSPISLNGCPSKVSSLFVAFVLTLERNSAYSWERSKEFSSTCAVYTYAVLVTFTVSIGNTPSLVLRAIANFPFLPSAETADQPPNSSISFTSPACTFLRRPTSSIEANLVSLLIEESNPFKLLANSATLALSPGNVYVWFADGSVSVVAPSVRNGLLLSNAFPWRSSLEPEFAIEFVSAAFSVFVAFLPTVAFPFVVSTAGACFFSSGFVCNFVVAVTSLLCACVNSLSVVALLKTDLASSKIAFNWFTLSSVLEAYFPLVNFPSISSISFDKANFLSFESEIVETTGTDSWVSFELPTTSPSGLFSTFAAETEVLVSSVDTPVVDELLGIRGLEVCLFSFTLTTFWLCSAACTSSTELTAKKTDPNKTDAAPIENLRIEKRWRSLNLNCFIYYLSFYPVLNSSRPHSESTLVYFFKKTGKWTSYYLSRNKKSHIFIVFRSIISNLLYSLQTAFLLQINELYIYICTSLIL